MNDANRLRILIVDDKPTNLLAMERVLASVDADLVTAESGNEALTKMIHEKFALVLLDVQMPMMDGIEVAQLMRAREATRSIPVIFVTAIHQDSEHTFRGYEAGAVDFLFKPIDPVVLRSKVRVFLELARNRRALEERNTELQDFAQLAAHDLKAPLRAIENYAQFAREDLEEGDAEKAQSHLERVMLGAERMTKLISDLLEYAKAGRCAEVVQCVSLGSVVDEAMMLLAEPCREARASIEVSPLPEVMGNRTGLIQLMQNLIGNAIKFRGEAAPVIRVEAERQSGGWRIRVSDNGIGISPGDREIVFSPLKRLHSQRQYEGTGLGLANCRKIVECHGGRIWVEPNQGGSGSAFCFTLPDGPDLKNTVSGQTEETQRLGAP